MRRSPSEIFLQRSGIFLNFLTLPVPQSLSTWVKARVIRRERYNGPFFKTINMKVPLTSNLRPLLRAFYPILLAFGASFVAQKLKQIDIRDAKHREEMFVTHDWLLGPVIGWFLSMKKLLAYYLFAAGLLRVNLSGVANGASAAGGQFGIPTLAYFIFRLV